MSQRTVLKVLIPHTKFSMLGCVLALLLIPPYVGNANNLVPMTSTTGATEITEPLPPSSIDGTTSHITLKQTNARYMRIAKTTQEIYTMLCTNSDNPEQEC